MGAKDSKNKQAMAGLSPEQFRVTQQNSKERPFDNAFWDHKEPDIYVGIVSAEPLFSSVDKFDSGCGWPSFTKPIEPENVEERVDTSHGMVRTEVRSSHADSHLGHVFQDGPRDIGIREGYVIVSTQPRCGLFPSRKLDSEGHGEYRRLFEHEHKEKE